MFKAMTCAALGALAISQAAFAEVRTYDFSATVESVGGEGSTLVQAPAWDESGRTITSGDRIVGRFSFDDSGAAWRDGSATQPFEQHLDATLSFSLERLGLSVSMPATLRASSFDSGRQFMSVGGVDAPAFSVFAVLFLNKQEAPGTPYPTDLTVLNDRWFKIEWNAYTFSYDLGATVDSFTEVSPVPEPATYGMMMAGLILVGAAARRGAASGKAI